MAEETYLGDSVYVRTSEGDTVQLYLDNGRGATNVIYMEAEVLAAFIKWLKANGKLN